MRYILPILFFIASCSDSKTEQCKKDITKEAKATLNDPESYEAVSFSPLMPIYACDKYNADIQVQEYYTQNGLEVDKHKVIIDSLLALKEKIKSDSTIERYFIRHKYRAKNGFGGVVTKEDVFSFDASLALIHR